ncbi:ComE operon protein 2 [Listeria booriae]|uniref:ComE operon protein 2 n=1 Tax=Listeria booriae TaxID=1552123 RepID=UPI00162AECDD|nr:ComE operon protein 2 [Listeria booriae]MBC1905708.1 ComE operon protein 2 [Listeria booriae]
MQRIAWDQFFLAQSHLISSRSTCTRLMVGATIVRDKRIIAGGYNGSIAGGDHCSEEGCYVVEGHCIRTIHAEMNAILQCAKFGASTDHAEMYVTHFPCVACCKSIIQAGIKAVYYAKDYKNHSYAIELFERAGVEVKKVPFDEHVLSNTAQIEQTVIQTVQEVLQQEDIPQETITHLEDKLKEQFLK